MLLANVVETIKNFLWGGPLLIILFLVGIHQTVVIKGLQFRSLLAALALTFSPKSKCNHNAQNRSNQDQLIDLATAKGISSFEATMTALAGSVGTGNIAGIATAVAVGGAGALFWMWVVALFGMATAYAETVLALIHRVKNDNADLCGGPMYYLNNSLKFRKIAIFYTILVAIVAITLGCLVQANSVVDAILVYYPLNKLYLGIILSTLVGLVIVGGVKSIGKVAGILVPFMAIGYLLAGLIIIIYHYNNIIPGLCLIFKSAFTGQAPIGGFIGSTLWLAMQNGAQYGVFANEAGLGSLAIAAASAKTNAPVEQGLRSMAGVFIATMVICTITGLVLVVTDVMGSVDSYGVIKGSKLVILAFSKVNPKFNLVVIASLAMFAFTTTLAWAYYGEKSIEYLGGNKLIIYYRWIFLFFILVGSILKLDLVWSIANLSTALMALPNLGAIMLLSKEVKLETEKYFNQI